MVFWTWPVVRDIVSPDHGRGENLMSRNVWVFAWFFFAALPAMAADSAISQLVERSLKCWEGGALILHEKKVHVTSPGAGATGYFVVRRSDGRTIIVYPGGGTCVLVEK